MFTEPSSLRAYVTACCKQVAEGDNVIEKPMWAAHGGLDFDGRENWDQWTKLKVQPLFPISPRACKIS